MRSPPILRDDDEDAEAQATQARAEGETVIRDHLTNHLEHNPGASGDYISWIATLHPENAEIAIDQRFFIPGNPWLSIYEETVHKMPYTNAVAIPVTDDQPPPNDDEEDKHSFSSGHASVVSVSEATPVTPSEDSPPPHFLFRCNPVDILIGLMITSHAILGTVIMEVLALVIYFIAALFYHSAFAMGPPNLFTGFFYSLCMILYFCFALADSIVLLSSVLVTEILDSVGWILGCLFGGIWMANRRHQYVRRVCHHIRWAFRHPHLHPPRTLCKETPVGTADENQEEGSDHTTSDVDTDAMVDIDQRKDTPYP
jgi:hypothetical protein